MKKKKKKIEKKESYDINEFLVSIGTIIDEYDKITFSFFKLVFIYIN